MRTLKFLLLGVLLSFTAMSSFAQQGGAMPDQGDEFIPDAIYEVRYWSNMARFGDGSVYIDTMLYFGNDRAVFEYSNARCVSYHCKASDSLIYVLMPKFRQTSEKEWLMGENFVRRLHRTEVPFRGRARNIYKIYTSDLNNKDTGIGDYALVSDTFGVIYRYNADGEVYMLNRIDVIQNGTVKDEIDLLPLQVELNKTDIFSAVE